MSDTFQARWQAERAAWVDVRGKQVGDSFGDLPKMYAGDSIVLIAPWTSAVQNYIIKHNLNVFAGNDQIAAAASQLPFGVFPPSFPVETYLMKGRPYNNRAALRVIPIAPGIPGLAGVTSVPIEPNWTSGEYGPDIMTRWQNGIDICARILSAGPVDRRLTNDELRAGW